METPEVQYIAMLPDNVIAVLEQFRPSAEGVEKFSQLVITEVEEGRQDPLKVALYMKTLEKIVKNVSERLSEHYLREAQKYGEKTFKHLGADISVGEVYTAYDYSACKDPVWSDLEKIIISAGEQMKEREKLLKTLTKPFVEVIEGEAVTINPPVRKSREGIKISIK
jgi:hypothetical protein